MVKNLPAMQETWVRSQGWEDHLEEGIATHSGILAWRITMDRGAWQAAAHGVSNSQTQLSNTMHNTKNMSFGILQGQTLPPLSVNSASRFIKPELKENSNLELVGLSLLVLPGKKSTYGTGDQSTEPLLRRQNTSEIAQGVSIAGLPFALDGSMTLEGMAQTLWHRQQEGRSPLGLWSQLRKGTEIPYTPAESQLLALYMCFSRRSSQKGVNHSHQRADLRVVWLLMAHEHWLLAL